MGKLLQNIRPFWRMCMIIFFRLSQNLFCTAIAKSSAYTYIFFYHLKLVDRLYKYLCKVFGIGKYNKCTIVN